jgi:hypothetical protein
MDMDRDFNTTELKNFIRDLIEEEFTPQGIDIGPRWEGGKMILAPGNDTQSKEIPLEVFFKKLLTVRDALRVLEQKLNSHPNLSQTEKSSFHSYITKAYGTLTTFNILFKDDKHKFVGQSGKKEDEDRPQMTMAEAKKKLGLNEY